MTRNIVDAFNRADWDGVVQDVTADFECDFSRANGPMRGVYDTDQWGRFLIEWGESWQRLRIDADEFVEVAEHVVVPWTMHTTGRGGIEVVARTCWAFTFHDGRLAALTYYDRRVDALEAVGLSG